MSIEKYTTDQSKSTKQHLLYKHKIHGKSIFFFPYISAIQSKKKKKDVSFFIYCKAKFYRDGVCFVDVPFPPFFSKFEFAVVVDQRKNPKLSCASIFLFCNRVERLRWHTKIV